MKNTIVILVTIYRHPNANQFRPSIALRTDLSRITTELWEIYSLPECALILHMII